MVRGEEGKSSSPTAPSIPPLVHSPALLSRGSFWGNLVLGEAQPGQTRPSPEQTILKYR